MTNVREKAIIKKAQEPMPELEMKPVAVEKNNGKIYIRNQYPPSGRLEKYGALLARHMV